MKKVLKYSYFIGFIYESGSEPIHLSKIIDQPREMTTDDLQKIENYLRDNLKSKRESKSQIRVIITSMSLISKRNFLQRFFLSFRK